MSLTTNLRKAMIDAGWRAIDTKSNARAYADASGKRFGTLEKEGTRVALSIGEELVEERGDVMVYMTDEPSDAILRALIVDSEVRSQGKARRALKEITQLSDVTVTTLYLEPVPIEDKPVDTSSLVKLYSRFDFELTGPKGCVMMRRPHVNGRNK